MAQLDPAAIRARIRQARKEAGLTQEQLAALIERHKRTIENYERVRVPDFSELNKIARVLNRPVEWFLHGDQPDRDDVLEAIDDLRSTLEQVDRKIDVADLPARLVAIEASIRDLRLSVDESLRR